MISESIGINASSMVGGLISLLDLVVSSSIDNLWLARSPLDSDRFQLKG
jgi:hypothetical protein